MDLSVSSSFWCLGRAAVCDCGILWTFLLPFVFYSSDRSKAVVPVLVLLFVALWFILRGDLFMSDRVLFCSYVVVFFSPFSIAITSLWGERANLSDFCTFVRFELVWFCRFPLSLGVWEGCGL